MSYAAHEHSAVIINQHSCVKPHIDLLAEVSYRAYSKKILIIHASATSTSAEKFSEIHSIRCAQKTDDLFSALQLCKRGIVMSNCPSVCLSVKCVDCDKTKALAKKVQL